MQLPAVLVVGALTLGLVALTPRFASPLAWGVVIASLLLGPMFGPGLGLPGWVLDASPFSHVPTVPATGATPVPLLALVAAGLALAVIGAVALRRRSLALPA